jgi:hypothetical protein
MQKHEGEATTNIQAIELDGKHWVFGCTSDGKLKQRGGPFPSADAAKLAAEQAIQNATVDPQRKKRAARSKGKQQNAASIAVSDAAGGIAGNVVSNTPAFPADLMDNHELITDLARFAEEVLTERQVKKKWRFTDEQWNALDNDAVVEAVEAEKLRRIRDGSCKRERAQLLVVHAPKVVSDIMMNPAANARHRVHAAKQLDSFTGSPQDSPNDGSRFIITINMNSDGSDDPKNILHFDKAIAIDKSPNDAIEHKDDEQ